MQLRLKYEPIPANAVRNRGATWCLTGDTPMREVAGGPLLDKVFKALENGPEDDLPSFYAIFNDAGTPPSAPQPGRRRWWQRG